MISLTPGAGAINTMSNTLKVGLRRSIWGVLGQQAGLLIHIAVVAAGLGLLVAGSPVAFAVIRYVGAAYLVYLGVRKFTEAPAAADDTAAYPEGTLSMLARGLWVNLLNPKAVVFFLAFLPQFIRPAEDLLPQYAVLGLTVVIVDVSIMMFVFGAGARQFRRFAESERGQTTMNRVFGALFIAVGVSLAAL